MQRTVTLHVPSILAGAAIVFGLSLLTSSAPAPAVSPAMDTDLVRVRKSPKIGGTAAVTWYIEDGSVHRAEVAEDEVLFLVPRNLTAIKPSKAASLTRGDGAIIHR